MKDIDFLPEWYKSSVRREVSYRTQCMALGGIFLVLTVWSLSTSHSISKARAELADTADMHAQAESTSEDLDELESRLRTLQKKFGSMEEIDSRIDVASVLAEMSFLIKEEIVLSKVELIAERFQNDEEDKTKPPVGAVVRAAQARKSREQRLPLGNVRFRVVIAGLAANTGYVAALIRELEESPYFFQVVPAFSRSKEFNIESAPSRAAATDGVTRTPETRGTVATSGETLQVSEFEINCYLANYRKLEN